VPKKTLKYWQDRVEYLENDRKILLRRLKEKQIVIDILQEELEKKGEPNVLRSTGRIQGY